jgi:uncharacterized protein (DUF2062 family)
MGIVPIWGFQMLVAITVSILFKLNKALVILAANISIPPMIPVVLWLSHVTGKFWMGKDAQSISFEDDFTLELFHNNFIQYAVGAVTLSVVSGLFFGFLTYGLLKLSKYRKSARTEINV